MGEALLPVVVGGLSRLPVGVQFIKEESVNWTFKKDTQYANKFTLTAPANFNPADNTIYMIQLFFDTAAVNANNKNLYYKCSLEFGIVYKHIESWSGKFPDGSTVTFDPYYWTIFPYTICGGCCIPYDPGTGNPVGVTVPTGSTSPAHGIKTFTIQALTCTQSDQPTITVTLSGTDAWTTTGTWDIGSMVIRTMSSDIMR